MGRLMRSFFALKDSGGMLGPQGGPLSRRRIESGADLVAKSLGTGIKLWHAKGVAPVLDPIPADTPVKTNGLHRFHFHRADQFPAENDGACSITPRPWNRAVGPGRRNLQITAHLAKERIIAWDFGSRIGPELKTETLRSIHISALDLTDLFRVTLRPESSLMLIWRRSRYRGPN
jgi:hypothetical protein